MTRADGRWVFPRLGGWRIRRPKWVAKAQRPKKAEYSLFDVLAQGSEFGGTSFEKAVDGAAHEIGYWFDRAQVYEPIDITGSYTLIDRVKDSPKVAVYIDGPQHEFREEIQLRDILIRSELEEKGWTVVSIDWKDFYSDPISVMRNKLGGLY